MKRFGRLLLLVVVVVLAGSIVFYKRPLWVEQQNVHFGLFLHRVQSNYVMTPEGRVHYYEAEPRIPGGGVPLVLVHGLGDRGESWAPMLERLKKDGFHVYAPDLLGYGRSPKPSDSDYSIGTEEKFVTDFIDSIGLQKTDIGGWSMGGWIALKVAMDHPDLVDRVVVYDSAGIRYQVPGGAQLFHPTDGPELQRLASLLEPGSKPLPRFVRRDALRRMGREQWVVDRSVASMESGKDVLDGALGGLTEPLLIVWGSDDGLLPLCVGEKMHALDPRSELDVVEGCGHLAPKTCSRRVAAATASFLKANPAPVGGEQRLAKAK
ncbi:MAG: alpha/beta hydrolase [Acidobacteria bacterium]|nr:alpha/beta hydrolase [Acidobacteriota bacterium]